MHHSKQVLQNSMLFGSNVETGKAEHIHLKDMRKGIHYLRASASLPYLSRIVEIEGKKYLDGGCKDAKNLITSLKHWLCI